MKHTDLHNKRDSKKNIFIASYSMFGIQFLSTSPLKKFYTVIFCFLIVCYTFLLLAIIGFLYNKTNICLSET